MTGAIVGFIAKVGREVIGAMEVAALGVEALPWDSVTKREPIAIEEARAI
jgi:hypothetical protein